MEKTPERGGEVLKSPETLLPQGSIDLDLLGCEVGEHGEVAAAFGFGEHGADLALAPLEATTFQGVKGVGDPLDHGLLRGVAGDRDVGGVLEGAGKQRPGAVVGCGIERV